MRAVAELGDLGAVLLVEDIRHAREVLDRPWDHAEGLTQAPAEPADAEGSGVTERSARPARPGHEGLLPGLVLDQHQQTAATARGQVRLTPLEFGFLAALVSVPGQVCRSADLVARVWGTHHVGRGTQVHSVVKRLRRKLTDIQAPVRLETVRAVGFRVVHHRPSGTPAARRAGPARSTTHG